MQNLRSTVLVALGGALLVCGAYHVLVAAPRLRRLSDAPDARVAVPSVAAVAVSPEVVHPREPVADEAGPTAEFDRRLSALEATLARKIPHIGFVRYNAFEGVGGPDLSYALALLTKEGDGVVLSSIYSREQTRTYGKAVRAFTSAQDASNEELAAIAKARESAL